MKWQPYLTQVCLFYLWLVAQNLSTTSLIQTSPGFQFADFHVKPKVGRYCWADSGVVSSSVWFIKHTLTQLQESWDSYHANSEPDAHKSSHIPQREKSPRILTDPYSSKHTHTQPNQGRLLFSYDNGNRCKTLLPRKITVRTGWRAVVRDKSTEYDSWAWYKQQNSLVS